MKRTFTALTLVAAVLMLLSGCSSMEDDVLGTWQTTDSDGVTYVMHLNEGGGVLMEISNSDEGWAIEGGGHWRLAKADNGNYFIECQYTTYVQREGDPFEAIDIDFFGNHNQELRLAHSNNQLYGYEILSLEGDTMVTGVDEKFTWQRIEK